MLGAGHQRAHVLPLARDHGGLNVDQARTLKELESENARLKKLVAEQALDISILREASPGNP